MAVNDIAGVLRKPYLRPKCSFGRHHAAFDHNNSANINVEYPLAIVPVGRKPFDHESILSLKTIF
jgi:hypothetical protein